MKQARHGTAVPTKEWEMKKSRLTALIVAPLIAAAVPGLSIARTPADWTPLGSVGPWEIYSKKNDETAKLACVAYYNGDHRIQLTNRSLSLIFDGGIRDLTIELDGAPFQFDKASDLSQVPGVVHIAGAEFEPIAQASQIRLKINRLQGSKLDLKVDLITFPQLMNHFKESRCDR